MQGLRPLPASQGVRTAPIAGAGDRQPLAAFQPPSHRLGRPTASVFHWPHSPPYCGGPLYPLGGGYSPEVDTADSCAAALVDGWVSRFGVPQQITSDRGAQFTSSVWSSLLALLGIKSKLTTPYHPQANGAVERFHRRLKDALRARLAGSDWPSHLPWVLLSLRAAPREDSGVSAAELVYGCPLSLPGQFLTGSEQPPASFIRHLNSSLPCVADS